MDSAGPVLPGVDGVFKYSDSLHVYVLANREFAPVVLDDVEETRVSVEKFLDTAKALNKERATALMGDALDILIHHVFAGQDSLGWAYFDRYYDQPDRSEVKKLIQELLNESVVYQEMHHR